MLGWIKKRLGLGPKEAFAQLKEAAGEDDPVLFFLSSGADYKGQAQLAYTANGMGAAVDAAIDPGKIIGLSAEIGVNASLTRSKEVMVVAVRGPSTGWLHQRSQKINRPLRLSCLAGSMWEATAGVSLDVGVSFEAKVGLTYDAEKGGKAGGKVEHTFQEEDEDEEPDPSFEAEGISLGVEAKAGFGVGVSYKMQHIYAEDFTPLRFEGGGDTNGKADMRACLDKIFTHGSLKASTKKGACDFMNRYPAYFSKVSYETTFGHMSTKDIIKKLQAGIAKCPDSTDGKDLVAQAENWLGMMGPWNEHYQQKSLSFLRMCSHSPSIEAGFKATLEVKAELGPLASAGASAKVKGPTLEVAGKSSRLRYQTYWRVGNSNPIMFTQDTRFTYLQVDATALTLGAEAEVKSALLGKGKSTSESEKGKKVAEGLGLKWGTNRLTYCSAAVYWNCPDALPASTRPTTRQLQATLLPGSGMQYGQSCAAASLMKLASSYYPPDKSFSGRMPAWYASRLAASLHLSRDQLLTFLQHPSVYSILGNLNEQQAAIEEAMGRLGGKGIKDKTALEKAAHRAKLEQKLGTDWDSPAVLIEAGFSLPTGIQAALTLRHGVSKDGKSSEDLFLLDPDLIKNLSSIPAFRTPEAQAARLQSIRIRWRIQNLSDNDKERFPLGFSILGQKLKIALKQVDRAGSEGIVDLATLWFEGGHWSESSVDRYEKGVPPVILFCQ